MLGVSPTDNHSNVQPPSVGVTIRSMGAPASEDSKPEGRTGKPTVCCMAGSAKTWLDVRTDT